MNYDKWLEENYQHLYEIYHHIIVPNRVGIKPDKSSSYSFQTFCEYSYKCHGSRLV